MAGRGLAAVALFASVLCACGPKATPEVERANLMIGALLDRAPGDVVVGDVWANGSWTCGRFTVGGVEKGFLGETPGGLWIEGPDSEPYYSRAWTKFCSVKKPPLIGFKRARVGEPAQPQPAKAVDIAARRLHQGSASRD